MKRLLAIVVALALVVPGSALSAGEGYSGVDSAQRGTASLDFDVFTRDGKPRRVGEFRYENVDALCDEGGITLSGSGFGTDRSGPNARAKVENKEFAKTYPSANEGGGEGTFRIKGKFIQQNQASKGLLRVKGDFPAVSRTNCDSGRVNWTTQ